MPTKDFAMDSKLCIIGAGYVGLPLAMAFSKKFSTILYTHSSKHVKELKMGVDRTGSFSHEQILESKLNITSDIEQIRQSTIYIVTVPTPVDKDKKPDLTSMKDATRMVATVLKKGDIVVYESTVFIGCTEELCVPILEDKSRLKYNEDFFCGYSPERVNPTDKEHTLQSIKKIVSGSTETTTKNLISLYGTIVEAGIYEAPSIKVAEASKLLENIQRDVNIALMNELSHVYKKFGILTSDVIAAASTKWNFQPYYPGLVGGHCIGVDPYYLLYNSEMYNVDMPIVSQARKTNDSVAYNVVDESRMLMEKKGIVLCESNVLLLGLSFKENCSDIRTSQSAVLYSLLKPIVKDIDVVDPYVLAEEAKQKYNIKVLEDIPKNNKYELIIVAVAHNEFKTLLWDKLKKDPSVLFDVKGIVPESKRDLYL